MTIRELVVYDSEEDCPYLPGQSAKMPLRRPLETLSGDQFDERLACGDRRTGFFLYNTQCEGCCACEAIRLPLAEFEMSRSQRRVWRKGQHLELRVQTPVVDDERVRLFNRHRRLRGLAHERGDIGAFSYEHFLVDSCCNTQELCYYADNRLVAVAISDLGAEAMSAVYTYFDPEYTAVSLGVYSVLKQVDLCQQSQLEYLYLGYYIAESPHMKYKSGYLPHERRIRGRWQRFDRSARGIGNEFDDCQ